MEIENEQGEVAVTEKEIGAAEGFFGVMTTDPEKPGAGLTIGSRIKGILAVDESERSRRGAVFGVG